MEKRKAYDLIYLGLILRHLVNVTSSFETRKVIALFDKLHDSLIKSGLPVSTNSYDKFLIPIKERLVKQKKTKLIGDTLMDEIYVASRKIENTIYAEATIKDVYVLPSRRYNTEFLNTEPPKILREGAFNKLTEIAAFDFVSACKCILFGLGTASAFHILRTTEEVLKQFYFTYKKTNRLDKPMWGPMTNELRVINKNKPDPLILESLDIVRKAYRNPTQHPELKYDIESAQDLFGLCVDLINKMLNELE